jgi:hypothetical protein
VAGSRGAVRQGKGGVVFVAGGGIGGSSGMVMQNSVDCGSIGLY